LAWRTDELFCVKVGILPWKSTVLKEEQNYPDFMRNWGNHLSVLFLLVEGS